MRSWIVILLVPFLLAAGPLLWDGAGAKLINSGTVNVNGVTITDSAGNVSIPDNTDVTGILAVTGSVTVDNLDLNGNTITSTDTNGNIVLTPDGAGVVTISSSIGITGTATVTGDLQVDNININGNAIISTDTDGDVTITPNGTGTTVLDDLNIGGHVISANATDEDVVLYPNGTGALAGADADSTAAGGNARGTYAVDWQLDRNAATQVASGAYSAILGGRRNSATNTQSAVLGGLGNTVSQIQGTVLNGESNTASALRSTVINGITCTASHSYAICNGAGGVTEASYDLVLSQNYSGTSVTSNNFFRIDGSDADIHVGRYTDQSAVGSASNVLKLHTTNASNQSNFIGLKAASLTATTTYTLPGDGSSGETLTTNGSGTLAWGTDVLGTATNDAASAGEKGEFMSDTGSGAAPADATWEDVASVTLTAGDWDVEGTCNLDIGSLTDITLIAAGISDSDTAVATINEGGVNFYPTELENDYFVPSGTRRFSLSTSDVIYLDCYVAYGTVGSAVWDVNSNIRARRIR